MSDSDLVAHDLRPLPSDLSADDLTWLRELHERVVAGDLVVQLGRERDEDMPVVWCAENGRWWAGRYVGAITFKGRRLRILPRVGMARLAHWLAAASHIALTPASASLQADEQFLPQLLAYVWSQTLVDAARHGPPYLRVESRHQGRYVRGRLDVRGTARLLPRRTQEVVSRDRERTLDHDLSRVIVAAEDVLNRTLGGSHWLSHNLRAKDILAPLRGAVGSRPRLPGRHDLNRIRYTPIRRPWESVAELSYRIATSRGFLPSASSQEATGILVDVAELWELFVLEALRRAVPTQPVRHGTTELTDHPSYLLQSSQDPDVGLGRLLPDYLVGEATNTRWVLDAKYKSLSATAGRPTGVQREDLYQLGAYMGRFSTEGVPISGALLYPSWEDDIPASRAVADGPWHSPTGGTATFAVCPTELTAATAFLRELVTPCSPGQAV